MSVWTGSGITFNLRTRPKYYTFHMSSSGTWDGAVQHASWWCWSDGCTSAYRTAGGTTRGVPSRGHTHRQIHPWYIGPTDSSLPSSTRFTNVYEDLLGLFTGLARIVQNGQYGHSSANGQSVHDGVQFHGGSTLRIIDRSVSRLLPLAA